MQPFIELIGITKQFPGIKANDGVDCSFQKGEIHALLGENGAGKSTLMNIMYGLYQPDEGQILINGEPISLASPLEAIDIGIGMVHQHFMLIPKFTISENIVLGNEPKGRVLLDKKAIDEKIGNFAAELGFQIQPDAKVCDISVGMQQKVEILKALYRGAEILILDEPTAVLTPQEIEELGNIMHSLTQQGKAVVLITHKLKEVLKFSDRITVIRRGKIIGTLPSSQASEQQLAEMMVGRHVTLKVDKETAKPKGVVAGIQGVSCLNERKLPALKGIDMELRAGEIVGIAGIEGNGQTELIEVLTGLRKVTAGSITVCGKQATASTASEMISLGVGCIPEDRHRYGLVLPHTIEENFILKNLRSPSVSHWGRIKWKAVREQANKLIRQFDVRTHDSRVKAGALSGGNQQKVVIAREVSEGPKLLLAAQPTRGLDIGAIEFVHKTIIQARDNDMAVLLISYELDEIMALSDRILVLYGGKIVGELDPEQTSEEQIGILMAGGSNA